MIDVIYQKREPGFHQGFQFKHRETDETAECFYCFEVFGTPNETQSTSFRDDSNEKIKKYTVIHFFCSVLSPPPQMKEK